MDTTKVMPSRALYRMVRDALAPLQRPCYPSLKHGVFLLAADRSSYHHFELGRYTLSHRVKAPLLPRLSINGQIAKSPVSISRALGAKAPLDPHCMMRLEITTVDSELELLFNSLPGIVLAIEAGRRKEFQDLLPFKGPRTSGTNIWSPGAREAEREVLAIRHKLARK